ncbi:MAG: hypothetical protein JSU63_13215 [Phycisphaerales bacterium]|nr:MAG: hypothetical protein JSU63_13215 [Phycisphaerales bacterium]
MVRLCDAGSTSIPRGHRIGFLLLATLVAALGLSLPAAAQTLPTLDAVHADRTVHFFEGRIVDQTSEDA